ARRHHLDRDARAAAVCRGRLYVEAPGQADEIARAEVGADRNVGELGELRWIRPEPRITADDEIDTTALFGRQFPRIGLEEARRELQPAPLDVHDLRGDVRDQA